MIIEHPAVPYLDINRAVPTESFGDIGIERQIEAMLAKEFPNCKRQVSVSGGIIDIVTNIYAIEVKRLLTNNSVKTALGQVLLYSQLVHKEPCIAGYPGPLSPTLLSYVRKQGTHIIFRHFGHWHHYPPA